MLATTCHKLSESKTFQDFILGVIVFTAVIMGLETYAPLQAAYGLLLHGLNIVIQAIFVFEIGIRVLAHWPRLGSFFATAGTSSILPS